MVCAITFWHPAAISSLSRHFAARRGLAIGLHGTGGSLGEAVGPVLVGFLLIFLTWRVILQASLIPAILIGGGVLLLLRRVPLGGENVTSVADYMGSLRRLLRNRRLVLVLLLAGGFAGGQSVIFTFLPIYLDEVLEVSTLVRGGYMFLAQVGGVGAQPAMGYLSDRLGRKMVLVPGLFLLGLTMLALSVAPAGRPLALVVLTMGTVSFSLMAILLAAATDLVEPGVQATTVSLVFASAVVVSGLSPAVAGLLADAVSVKATFVFASGLIMTTALVATATRWQRTAA
jgi:predicted MFS family arabinose efflux permease